MVDEPATVAAYGTGWSHQFGTFFSIGQSPFTFSVKIVLFYWLAERSEIREGHLFKIVEMPFAQVE